MVKELFAGELSGVEYKDVEFTVDGKRLAGFLVKAPQKNNPTVLILAGGANIGYKEGYYIGWQEQMARLGLDSLSFDYRGVGASEGKLTETTLETRLEDARAASEIISTEKLYVCGISMGVPLAIQLANEVHAKGLILLSPGAYSAKAWAKPFGPAFREAIRKPNSWEDSTEFDELEKFQGKALLVYGEHDDVVPWPVLERYAAIVGRRGTVLAFDVGHRFMRENDPASIQAREALDRALAELASN